MALSERDWWVKVGRLIDPNIMLQSWDGQISASFTNPIIEIDGRLARVILIQQKEIDRLNGALQTTLGNVASQMF